MSGDASTRISRLSCRRPEASRQGFASRGPSARRRAQVSRPRSWSTSHQRGRRRGSCGLPDRTQRWRRAFQAAFLLLNVAIGVQFWFFVRFFESDGEGIYLPRPPGIEGWLPIAALMNLKAAVLTGELPRRFPAGPFLLVALLAITFLFRKAFCSWLCPVGTLSEGLWKLGRRLFRRTFELPRWADLPLRTLKYVLLGFFVWAVAKMSVEAIRAFLASPYGLVADVKMLNFFRHMGTTAESVAVGWRICFSGASHREHHRCSPRPPAQVRSPRPQADARDVAHGAQPGAELHHAAKDAESVGGTLTAAIDTLKLAKRFEGFGFTWRQASALARFMNEVLVECGRSTGAELAIAQRLDLELAKLRAEQELAAAKASTRRWMIGGGLLYVVLNVAQVVMVALARAR
jgi:hypothetical protein